MTDQFKGQEKKQCCAPLRMMKNDSINRSKKHLKDKIELIISGVTKSNNCTWARPSVGQEKALELEHPESAHELSREGQQ